MHLLQQTSEWEGSCFGIPDQVDRYRKLVLDPKPVQGQKGDARPLQTPGTYWEYNDVRINQLSLSLLHLFGQALPQVFEQSILHPIGGGKGFRWEGYEQSWVDLPALNGQAPQRVASVPAGSHGGGGVCISTSDQARIAQLVLQQGQWTVDGQPRSLVPAAWLERMRQPQALAPFYGWLNWLNPKGQAFPVASEASQFMFCAGGNYVWIEPAHHAVVVVRWIEPAHFPGFVTRMAQALAAVTGGR
jgi:CubicO group peptidase (beta-lactamase class C family)